MRPIEIMESAICACFSTFVAIELEYLWKLTLRIVDREALAPE